MPLPRKFESIDALTVFYSDKDFKPVVPRQNLCGDFFGYIEVLKLFGKKNKKPYYIVKCARCNGGYYLARQDTLLSRKVVSCGCNSTLKSKEGLLEGLPKFGYKLTEELKDGSIRSKPVNITCPKGHNIFIQPDKLLSELKNGKKGCSRCRTESRLLSKSAVVERCSHLEGRVLIGIEKYKGSRSLLKFNCNNCRQDFNQIYYDAVSGSSCNKCVTKGFKKDEPCFIYLIDFTDFCKIGISIRDPQERLNELNRRSKLKGRLYKVFSFQTAREALDVETAIKNSVPCGVVSKEILPNGFTETFKPEHCKTVLNILEENNQS